MIESAEKHQPENKSTQSVDLTSIKDVLSTVDCDISFFDLTLVEQVLRPDLPGITVTSSMDQDVFNKWLEFSEYLEGDSLVLISNPETPKVLFEDSASFCSILFSIDESGKSLLLHYPVISDNGALILTEELEKQLQSFKKAAQDLSQNRKNVLTATNVSDENRANIFEFITNCIGEDLHLETVFTPATFPVQKSSESNSVQLTEDFINGVLIIPKQLTKDQRTKVFLLTNRTRYTYDKLLSALTKTIAHKKQNNS